MKKQSQAVLIKDLLTDMMLQIEQQTISDQFKIEEAWLQIKQQYTSEAYFDGFFEGIVYIGVEDAVQRFLWHGRRQVILRQLQMVSQQVTNIVFKIRKRSC